MSELNFHDKNNITGFFAGSGELEFEEFCILAARFLIEEDEEQMRKELKEAFRFYDKEGRCTCPCQSRIYFMHRNNSDNLKSPLDGVPIATKVKIPILKSMKNLVKLKIFTIFFIAEGYLTVETLSSILLELEPDLSAEQLKEIIDEVDEDGSGTIDYDGNFEFYVAKMTPFNFLNFLEFMNMMMG